MKTAGLLVLLAGLLGAADPRIFYSKSFPGSSPAYTQITLDRSGNAVYQEAMDDDLPLKFKLEEASTSEVFGLAEKVGNFKSTLESGLKVAFMGAKTFRYEDGQVKNEAKFNYSEDLSAQAILDWFEKMAESAQLRIELEKTAKYDKLGVDRALRLLLYAMDRKRLVALEQFLPMLDRVANNESYMHTARAKAAELSETIRATKP